MEVPRIKLHQVYKSKQSGIHVEIIGHKGGKYKTRVLTAKTGVYNGSHLLASRTIQKMYELVDKQ